MTQYARTAVICAMIASMMISMALLVPAPASASSGSRIDQLTTESGSTEILGGGSHFFIKFGSDAAFGIVWGNDTKENNIYFVSIVARNIGLVNIYDNKGDLVLGNHTVRIYTMYAVKLDSLIEFNDLNGDGTLQYHRAYDKETGEFKNYTSSETIYKMASLKTAWSASPVNETNTSDARDWSFSLTATNLSYVPLNLAANQSVGDYKLNEVRLTFHLEAKVDHVENATIPEWRVTVTTGPFGGKWFHDAEFQQNKTVSGDYVKYHVKWDKVIQGWDFDPSNTHPTLLMEFQSILGNYIPPSLVAAMEMAQYKRMVANMGEDGYAIYDSPASHIKMNESFGEFSSPRALSTPRITFGGDRSKIGALEWNSNVTVDGKPGKVHGQVLAAFPITTFGGNGALFTGFVLLGGLDYPGGSLIVQDPTFSSETLLNVSLSTGGGGAGPLSSGLIGLLVLVVAGIVIVSIVLVAIRRPGAKTKDSYEKPSDSQQGDWSKYYEKK
jgi:hypothetical protein